MEFKLVNLAGQVLHLHLSIFTSCLCGFYRVRWMMRWSKIQLEDEFIISKELIGSWHYKKVNCCINGSYEEAQVTNVSWWHRAPNHNKLSEVHISFEAAVQVSFIFFTPNSGTFVSETDNQLGLIKKYDKRSLFCHPIFILPAPLQPLVPLSGIEQSFYSWYATAETLFVQPLMNCSVRCLHSSFLSLSSQLIGAVKLTNWRSFLFKVDLFWSNCCISKAFGDNRLGNSEQFLLA